MKVYTPKEFEEALRAVGIAGGDVLYFSSRLFTLGRLEGAASRDHFCELLFEAVLNVIGPQGTLVVPTFTQQVAGFGMPYVHEETPCQTGLFGEYVRTRAGALRSVHPVFSLTAIGERKAEICENCSTTGFGYDSAMERLFRIGAKAACVGFPYYDGHIVAGLHSIETLWGVPYYYNKILDSDVFVKGQKCAKVYVINVRYRDFDINFDLTRATDFAASRQHITSAAIGDGMLHCYGMKEMFRDGFDLLNQDPYAFLKQPPAFRKGTIPFEGCESKPNIAEAAAVNWVGAGIADRG